jgi:hypothetical protein
VPLFGTQYTLTTERSTVAPCFTENISAACLDGSLDI